jgi:hypothetical protein
MERTNQIKLIPISRYIYDQVMEEMEKIHYSPEQKYHILRYLINFLESKQGEIAKKIS